MNKRSRHAGPCSVADRVQQLNPTGFDPCHDAARLHLQDIERFTAAFNKAQRQTVLNVLGLSASLEIAEHKISELEKSNSELRQRLENTELSNEQLRGHLNTLFTAYSQLESELQEGSEECGESITSGFETHESGPEQVLRENILWLESELLRYQAALRNAGDRICSLSGKLDELESGAEE
jgi:predicted nuclease with TOPRIM domain